MEEKKSNGHSDYDKDFLFVEYCQYLHQMNSRLRILIDLPELPFDIFYSENLDLLTHSFQQLIQEGVTHE